MVCGRKQEGSGSPSRSRWLPWSSPTCGLSRAGITGSRFPDNRSSRGNGLIPSVKGAAAFSALYAVVPVSGCMFEDLEERFNAVCLAELTGDLLEREGAVR